MSNPSKKHHFIPQFYQRGFASDDAELFGLKKKHGSIRKWSTAQILYKKDLHTVTFGQDKTSMIEEFYSGIEGQFSNYLKLLKENIHNPQVVDELFKTEEFVKLMKAVVSFQFWRTPSKRKLALEYSSELLDRYDKATDEIKEVLGFDRKLIKHLMKRADKDDSIKFIQFVLLPLLTFDLSSHPRNIKFFTASGSLSFFSSDEPVIYDDLEKLFRFESVWFPLSKELLLLASEKNLEKIDINKINKVILDRADEIVICSSREQLEEMKCNKSIQPTAEAAAD